MTHSLMVYFNGYQIRNHKTKQKFKTTNSQNLFEVNLMKMFEIFLKLLERKITIA